MEGETDRDREIGTKTERHGERHRDRQRQT